MTKKVSVTFHYSAKVTGNVTVAGTFNDWDASSHPLKRKKDGTWFRRMMLPPGRYEYRFVINGEHWVSDPQAQETCENQLGDTNCVLHVQ